MLLFVLGLGVFFGLHVLTFLPLRQRCVSFIGNELVYKIIFAVLSGLALIVAAVGKGGVPYVALWQAPYILRIVAVILILVAYVLIACAHSHNNIKRLLRPYVPHPMLAGVFIWAFSHLLVNGDIGSLILFLSFSIYSAGATYLLLHRATEEPQQEPATIKQDGIVLAWAFGVYIITFALHDFLFGRPVFFSS